jgi:hypothetical protein
VDEKYEAGQFSCDPWSGIYSLRHVSAGGTPYEFTTGAIKYTERQDLSTMAELDEVEAYKEEVQATKEARLQENFSAQK